MTGGARAFLRGGAIAAAAGAAYPLAFAPFGWWPLAPLGLAVLFRLWSRVSARRAAWLGWCFGAGLYGAGIFWIHESFRYSQAAPVLAYVLTALLVAAFALYPALLGALARRAIRSRGPTAATLLGLLPAGWVLTEWVRGWLLTGFPWLQAGYSQVDGPLAGLAPVLGTLGLTWLLALAAGVLAWAFPVPRRLLAAGVLGALVAASGIALRGVEWTAPRGEPLRATLLQGNVPQDVKWQRDRRQEILDRYAGLTREHPGSDLVVWPETAIPAFQDQVPDYLDALGAWGTRTDTTVLLGLPYRDRDGSYYNSVLALGAGEGVYHKRHLVPFGEYVPLADLLGPVLDVMRLPMSRFSAGAADQHPLPAAGRSAGVLICYEVLFSEAVRRRARDVGVWVNVSNDAWFGDSIGPAQHLEIARMRALETGRPLLRATNTGITAVIGAQGRVQARVPQFQTVALNRPVQPRSGLTPFARWGEAPVVAGAVAVLVVLVTALRRRRP